MIRLKAKDEGVFYNLLGVRVHYRVTEILVALGKWGTPVVTSAYREHKAHAKDSGIHSTDPLRAVDIRSWIYSDPEMIVDWINLQWEYDNQRPWMKCAILHNTGSGEHIHVQVHPNTRRRRRSLDDE